MRTITDPVLGIIDAAMQEMNKQKIVPGYTMIKEVGITADGLGSGVAAYADIGNKIVCAIGPALNEQALAIQPISAYNKVPVISYGAAAVSASGLAYFMRTVPSNMDQIRMMLAVCDDIGLTFGVAAVASENRAGEDAIKNLQKLALSVEINIGYAGGFLVADTGSLSGAAYVESELAKLEVAQAGFVLLAANEMLSTVLMEICGNSPLLSRNSVAWWTMKADFSQLDLNKCTSMSGFLTGLAKRTMTTPSSQKFLQAFQAVTGTEFSELAPTADEHLSAWNAVVAVSNALKDVLALSIYTNNVSFSPTFMKKAVQLNVSAAGGPIVFNKTTNDVVLTYTVVALNEDVAIQPAAGNVTALGYWSFAYGLTNFLGKPKMSRFPETPDVAMCRKGEYHVNKFVCRPCKPGTYSDYEGDCPPCSPWLLSHDLKSFPHNFRGTWVYEMPRGDIC